MTCPAIALYPTPGRDCVALGCPYDRSPPLLVDGARIDVGPSITPRCVLAGSASRVVHRANVGSAPFSWPSYIYPRGSIGARPSSAQA